MKNYTGQTVFGLFRLYGVHPIFRLIRESKKGGGSRPIDTGIGSFHFFTVLLGKNKSNKYHYEQDHY